MRFLAFGTSYFFCLHRDLTLLHIIDHSGLEILQFHTDKLRFHTLHFAAFLAVFLQQIYYQLLLFL
jgi:hypothetical protein